jgi:hypothetical protein
MTPTPAATITRIDADCASLPWWAAGMWNPLVRRNPTSAHQKMTLSTTAEPIPWVPRAKPVSDPETPDWVRSRYPSAAPGAVPPGETWLSAMVERLMRNSRKRRGPPGGSTAWVSWA